MLPVEGKKYAREFAASPSRLERFVDGEPRRSKLARARTLANERRDIRSFFFSHCNSRRIYRRRSFNYYSFDRFATSLTDLRKPIATVQPRPRGEPRSTETLKFAFVVAWAARNQPNPGIGGTRAREPCPLVADRSSKNVVRARTLCVCILETIVWTLSINAMFASFRFSILLYFIYAFICLLFSRVSCVY